jgi:hypothetical protein
MSGGLEEPIMFRPLIAVLVLAASPTAALAQKTNVGAWALEKAPQGCMIYATSAQGSVLSVSALAGNDSLSFLVQNRNWSSLPEGTHNLQVAFDKGRTWPVQAVARHDIDSDGPGLLFTIKAASGSNGEVDFVDQFAAARGMDITSNGQRIDSLALSDSDAAVGALAQCIGELWRSSAGAEPASDSTPSRAPLPSWTS